MTASELYNFIDYNSIEWDKFHNNKGLQVTVYLSFLELEKFCEMLDDDFLDEESVEVFLQKDGVCVQMDDICEYYEIDMDRVFSD